MSQGYQPPDLAAVLRTLASLAPQNAQQNGQPGAQHAAVNVETPPQRPQVMATPPPSDRTLAPAMTAPAVDPTTITDWSAGLRCVMKAVSKNESILQEVKKVSF